MGMGFLNLYRFSQQVAYQSHYGGAQKLKLGLPDAAYPTVSAGLPRE